MNASRSNMNEPVIRLESVSKVFETDEIRTYALSSINLEIARGEYVSISGPSCSDKSTLLSTIGLWDSPTTGIHYLNGKPAKDLSISQRATLRNMEIGFIFQAFNLIGGLTVYENVELPLIYRGLPAS